MEEVYTGAKKLQFNLNTEGTMAPMAHFSFPYFFTIPNSEFRNLHYEFRNSNSEL